MADDWKGLESWERVKWARSQHYDSASAAAHVLDMKEGTYRCYERGPGSAKFMPLEYNYAKKFGRQFKVRWEWLLEGVGEPWLTDHKGGEEEAAPAVPHHLRDWREYRGFTVDELAKRAKTNAQTIRDLESGAAELSPKWMMTLAPVLGTTQGRIIDLDPNENDPSLFDAIDAIPKDQRAQALEILRTFRRPAYKRQAR